MTWDDVLIIGMGVSAFVHALAFVYIYLAVRLIRRQSFQIAEECQIIEHLQEQNRELTNVIGDSVADRYLWNEERQELIAKLFALQRPIDTTKGETD